METEDDAQGGADRLLAARYFDQWIVIGLEGLPEDAIQHLRERYIKDVLADPDGMAQLREIYG